MKLRLACFVALVICTSSLSGKVIEGFYHTGGVTTGWSIALRPDGRAIIFNEGKIAQSHEKNRWRNLSNGDALVEIWLKERFVMKAWIRTTSRGTYLYEIRAWPFRPEDADGDIRKIPVKFRRQGSLKKR